MNSKDSKKNNRSNFMIYSMCILGAICLLSIILVLTINTNKNTLISATSEFSNLPETNMLSTTSKSILNSVSNKLSDTSTIGSIDFTNIKSFLNSVTSDV